MKVISVKKGKGRPQEEQLRDWTSKLAWKTVEEPGVRVHLV